MMDTSITTLKRPFYLQGDFLIKTGLYLLLISGMYYSSLQWLIFKDWAKDDYSHCMLIPIIVLYLIWEKHHLVNNYRSKPSHKGFYIIVLGIGLFWLGELAGEFFTLYFSLWLIIVGLCYLNMGWEKLKIILFPILFSITMFPFPEFINNRITLHLKLISSKLGVVMMQLYGMSVFREGNMIDLGFTKLQIVDACSGLRYLFPMIVLSILIAHFYPARIWKKVLLVMSSVPLTIFSNSLRIALTGILSEKFGSKAVEGFFHDFEGWLIFMFTLIILLLEIWVINKIFPELPAERQKRNHTRNRGEKTNQDPKTSSLKRPQFILSVLLLSVTLVLSRGIEFREAIPMNRSFNEFPQQIRDWTGTRQFMETEFLDELNFSDYYMADYNDTSGKAVNFYVAYYESQRKGESIHSPASCLRGGGWSFKQAGSTRIDLADGSTIPVNRGVIEKATLKQLSYYWFPSRNRILTNAYQMKLFNFWDALTQKRTDGALVRVITLVYPDEPLDSAEKRIKQFISDMYPVLNEFLPQ